MPDQPVLEHANIDLTEWTLLMLGATWTLAEVALPIFVLERAAAFVGTFELADVEHVIDVSGDF